jgi:hypothetical protein
MYHRGDESDVNRGLEMVERRAVDCPMIEPAWTIRKSQGTIARRISCSTRREAEKMCLGAEWILPIVLFGVGQPSESFQPPELVVYVWSNGTSVEVQGCRSALYKDDVTRLNWVVRTGMVEAMAGLRGEHYLGYGWHVSANLGVDFFRGLTVTARLEWCLAEGIMFAAEWSPHGVRVDYWQTCDWESWRAQPSAASWREALFTDPHGR